MGKRHDQWKKQDDMMRKKTIVMMRNTDPIQDDIMTIKDERHDD